MFDGSLMVYVSNGDGTFASGVVYSGAASASVLSIGDFNGDGKLDVAVSTAGVSVPGQELVFLGNGDGRPDLVIGFSPGESTHILETGILLGNGDGSFGPNYCRSNNRNSAIASSDRAPC